MFQIELFIILFVSSHHYINRTILKIFIFTSFDCFNRLHLYLFTHVSASKCVQELSNIPLTDFPFHDMTYEHSRAATFKGQQLPETLTATSLAASGLYLYLNGK